MNRERPSIDTNKICTSKQVKALGAKMVENVPSEYLSKDRAQKLIGNHLDFLGIVERLMYDEEFFRKVSAIDRGEAMFKNTYGLPSLRAQYYRINDIVKKLSSIDNLMKAPDLDQMSKLTDYGMDLPDSHLLVLCYDFENPLRTFHFLLNEVYRLWDLKINKARQMINFPPEFENVRFRVGSDDEFRGFPIPGEKGAVKRPEGAYLFKPLYSFDEMRFKSYSPIEAWEKCRNGKIIGTNEALWYLFHNPDYLVHHYEEPDVFHLFELGDIVEKGKIQGKDKWCDIPYLRSHEGRLMANTVNSHSGSKDSVPLFGEIIELPK